MCIRCRRDLSGFCSFLSPDLLELLSKSGVQELVDVAFETERLTESARTRRRLRMSALQGRPMAPGQDGARTVFDMKSLEYPTPGIVVRSEGDPPSHDAAVDQAYEHVGTTTDFYRQVFRRRSLDDAGLPIASSVHFGKAVANAFWDGDQMYYGDGDGQYFLSFTRSLDIVAHELSHGVVSFTSNLNYRGESGALNESFCDVMGAMVVQWKRGQTFDEANWVVGSEVVGPALDIDGIRSFTSAPAYVNDPYLQSDPQPKHMKDFILTSKDNGGVHINSGIPNHAFYLASAALGGKLWETTGLIWYETFVKLGPQAGFAEAALMTRVEAMRIFGRDSAEVGAVAQAWGDVGFPPEESV